MEIWDQLYPLLQNSGPALSSALPQSFINSSLMKPFTQTYAALHIKIKHLLITYLAF